MGDKVKVSVLEVNGIEELEVPCERSLTADIVDFTNPTASYYRSTSDDVSLALDELKKFVVTYPQATTSTLNGTLTLTVASNTFQVVHGTATGFSVQLPPSTVIPLGSEYQIFNDSTQPVFIKDDDGTTLVTLNIESLATFKLEDNVTTAGKWIFTISSTTATGIVSYVVTSNTIFTTSSTIDDLITGFTVTPVSGRYSVFFSSDIEIAQNNRIAECVIYSNGVANSNTRRQVQGVSSNFSAIAQTIGEVTVDGTQAVDVRVNITAGSLDIGQRSLVLIRLGS